MKYSAGWYDYYNQEVCLKRWENDTPLVDRIPYRRYFFTRKDQLSKIQCTRFDQYIVDVESDGNFAKLYPNSSINAKEIIAWFESRDVDTYEADLYPFNRFMTDNDIEFEQPRILFFDLETDARRGFQYLDTHRILSVGYGSSSVDCLVVEDDTDKDEYKLLTEFGSIISKYDLLVAWNGKAYDEVVLKSRYKQLGLKPNWKMVNFLDMMLLFKHPYYGYGRDVEGRGVKISYALGNIAKTVLGYDKGKEKIGSNAKELYEAWRNNREHFVKYNKRDVEIMIELEEQRKYIEAITVFSHLCGRFLSDWSLYIGYLNDAFILRYGKKRGIHFRTKQHFFNVNFEKQVAETKKYKGAFVLEPKKGLHKKVTSIDFSALYANIIDAFNISPEMKTKDNGAVAINGIKFDMSRDGVFRGIIRTAKNGRKPWKEKVGEYKKQGKEETVEYRRALQRSDAWKFIGNGSYGALGAPFLRYYDPECAEAVTLTGQAIIRYVIDEAEKFGIVVLYGDTDSLYMLCIEEKALEFMEYIHKKLDDWVEERGGQVGLIRLDLEDTWKRIFWTSKKRYAGLKDSGKRDIKGLEFVRTDSCKLARDMQSRMIDYILEAKSPNPEFAFRMLTKWQDKLYESINVEDIQFSQSIGRPLDEYKTETAHVRVAKKMLEEGKEVFEGQKISYVVTGRTDKLKVIASEDFKGEFDPMLYWRDKVYPPTMRLLESVFPGYYWEGVKFRNPKQSWFFSEESMYREEQR